MIIPIKLLSPNGKVPTQARAGDAGYDLYAAHEVAIPAGARALIKTDIAVAIPVGWYGRIAPRSGLALKAGIHVLGGVVDAGYRSNVGCILINLSQPDGLDQHAATFNVAAGDRVAQLIIERCAAPDWQVVDDLDETTRGQGGFGSTGGTAGAPEVTHVSNPMITHTSIPDWAIPSHEVVARWSRARTADEIVRGYSAVDDQPFNPLDHEQTK